MNTDGIIRRIARPAKTECPAKDELAGGSRTLLGFLKSPPRRNPASGCNPATFPQANLGFQPQARVAVSSGNLNCKWQLFARVQYPASSPDYSVPRKPIPRVRTRGPAKYFHGREHVRGFLAQLRADAVLERSGTIFLIQGAPGAGKTALLHQCAVEADIDGWHVAKITIQALYEPAVMAWNLGERYPFRRQLNSTLDASVVAKATTTELAGAAAAPQVLKDLTPDTGLLLLLGACRALANHSGVVADFRPFRQRKPWLRREFPLNQANRGSCKPEIA